MDENRPGRVAPRDTFVPSVLDRLIAPADLGSGPSMGYGLQQLIEVVRRDLEDLLNTHQTFNDLPEELVELRNSVLAYGVPDFVAQGVTRDQAQRQIGDIVERVVNLYEPRLLDVRAIPADESAA